MTDSLPMFGGGINCTEDNREEAGGFESIIP
jgi:hypothetical protein